MDVVSQVLKHQLVQHHDRFCQFWMEYQEISAHIQELTASVQVLARTKMRQFLVKIL